MKKLFDCLLVQSQRDLPRILKSISTNVFHQCSICDPTNFFSQFEVLITNIFLTPPVKLKLRLQVGKKLLITTHLD
jgi:hypothetical protein